LERGMLARQIQERNHRVPPPSIAPRPTRVLMGPLTPSRFSVKRTSSSRLVRLTYSTANAQHCQWNSNARRLSTKVVVRTSQLIVPRVVSHGHGDTLNPPCTKVNFAASLWRTPTLTSPRGITVERSAVTKGSLALRGSSVISLRSSVVG